MKGKKQGMSDMERLHYLLNADFSNRSGCFVLTYDTADGEDVEP